ncbi:TMEM175 family protein [Enterococcus nangangensis]
MPKSRLEAFTDAVIAIIMTILVLELRAPESASWQALAAMEHKLVIYVVSFVALAIYWNNHHHMFQTIERINGKILWLNNLLIFSLSLIPFTAAWVGDHLFALAPQIAYAVVMLLADTTYYLLYRALIKANPHPHHDATQKQNSRKLYLSIGGGVLAILLGFFIQPILALVVNILVLAMWIIPDKTAEKFFTEKD